uniref:Uncharacterized protein n=1 Tax=Leptocylindrus danicus TaxID=163516 RepID=A0A6U2LII5_9STRA|mmetsp:Transcript_13310/g.19830  ORF Transcript_13310/g.19830 Transcript_13310/m.19830 type:complete len:145 (+) Transcript_13310:218-652(+)
MGCMTVEWRRSAKNLEHNWTSSCARLFLEWGCACWTHRNLFLYGPSSTRHQQRQKQLQAEAQVWITAPRTDLLVPIHNNARLKRDITRETTEIIATWLHRQNQLRKRMQKKKKNNIITDFISEATLQETDRIFHSKLIEARRGI